MTLELSRRPGPGLAAPGAGAAVAAVAILVIAAAALTALHLGRSVAPSAWWAAAWAPADHDADAILFHDSGLPRAAMAALCGAGLALAGGLTQAVLGNPLAVPGTLGVTAGAQLALLAATLLLPRSWPVPREAAALAGGLASFAAVFAVAAAGRFSTAALVLAGLSVGLFCVALGGALTLFNHEALSAAALWGAGSLAQDDWSVVRALAPRLAGLAALAALLIRPVGMMVLPDAGARGLGVSLTFYRLAALGVAVGLSAGVTAAVGIVGFVDLAAPLIVRLAGARRLGTRLALGAVAGAAILTIVDVAVQGFEASTGTFLPTGAATAVLAAPLLLAMLPRLRADARGAPAPVRPAAVRAPRPNLVLLRLGTLSLLAMAGALIVGRSAVGAALLTPENASLLLPWRAPRAGVAFAAGAALATSGALLQRCFGNPLASPESLGIGAAVLIGFGAALTVDPAMPAAGLAAAGAGSALVLLLMLAGAGLRARFAPDHLLLAGVALSAALNAAVAALLALNDGRAAALASWNAGSTAAADGGTAAMALSGAAVAVPASLLFARPLDLLPLGEAVARAAGVRPASARLGPMLLAALLTTGAVLAVGPLTFVGLLGPQLASRLGLARSAPHLVGSALAGGLTMVVADWLGRIVAAPFELPAGLTASLIGIPVLVLLLGRRGGPA